MSDQRPPRDARLDRHPQRPDHFLPLTASSHSSRGKKAFSYGRPPLRFGPLDAGRSSPVLSTAIETATLNLNVKATIRAVERTSEKGPDYRILAGATVEFGAAWKKTSNEGRDYLSVKLDDPSFPGPIYATLIEFEGEEGLSLIWSLSTRD